MKNICYSFVVLVGLMGSAVSAYSGGVSGYSGASGGTCTTCHGGGPNPTVTLRGPSTLTTGQTGSYTLTITGGNASQGGLDVAVRGGGSLVPGSGTYLNNGEVTHNTPGTFSGGSLSYVFSLVAPSSSGTITLYGAGLSSGGSTSTSGTGTAQMSVAVSAPPPPTVDAGSPPPADAGSPPPPVVDAGTPAPPPTDGGTMYCPATLMPCQGCEVAADVGNDNGVASQSPTGVRAAGQVMACSAAPAGVLLPSLGCLLLLLVRRKTSGR